MIRRQLMLITDLGMIAYWVFTALVAAGLIAAPMAYLFKDYDDPIVIAWNWSFLPLDLALSVTGLWALRLERKGAPAWRIWAAVSMTLTVCAGLMALAFWTLRGEFDPLWWAPNLFLMLWPLPFLAQLGRQANQASG